MYDILVVFVHFNQVAFVPSSPNPLTRHQILILNRSRKRGPSLHVSDRIIAGLCTLSCGRLACREVAWSLKPSTLLHFHHVLTKRKYRMLFSRQRGRWRGPKGPAKELIDAVIEVKRRNPSWGCP